MKTVLVTILLLSLPVAAILFIYSITRKDRSSSIYFSVLVMAGVCYAFGYILELLANDISSLGVALKVENVGIPMLAPFFLLLITGLCRPGVLKPWMGGVAFAYSYLMTVCVLFNDLHGLYYSEIQLVTSGNWTYTVLGKGPLYHLNQTAVVLCMLAAYLVLFTSYRRWTNTTRKQMAFVLIGSTTTFAANVVNILQILPLDVTPFACLLTLLLFAVSIFRYKLFDIVPLASETAVRTMDDAIIILDNEWRYLFSNDSAARLFPALSRVDRDTPMEQVKSWPDALKQHKRAGHATFQLGDMSGKVCHYRANISAVGSEQNPLGWSIVIRDVSEMMQLMQQLEVLATTDPLTGIFNRRYFIQMAERELELARRHPHDMAMLMFDLDNFKLINDRYGHLVGDYVLKSVVQIVRSGLRPYDIFARYGGEEFVIFAMKMDCEDGIKFAGRLCRSIAESVIEYKGEIIPVTASFGVTQVRPHFSLEMATAAADKALYEAKAAGRNCVRFQKVAGRHLVDGAVVIEYQQMQSELNHPLGTDTE